jgi:hypothetical protein
VRRKPSANRPKDEDTLEMLRNIMNRNPSTRELFELKCAVSPPRSLDAMITLIRSMLRVRKAAVQLDELTSTDGTQLNALTVQQVKDLQKIPEAMRTPQANRGAPPLHEQSVGGDTQRQGRESLHAARCSS